MTNEDILKFIELGENLISHGENFSKKVKEWSDYLNSLNEEDLEKVLESNEEINSIRERIELLSDKIELL